MDVPNQPKPKRKFVMTPERRAKLLANLEKARLAPKEKVYRKTPKRYAANLANLAKAHAKRRQQSESQQAENLRAQLEGLFPAPQVPPPPQAPLGAPYVQLPGARPSGGPSGAEELDQAAALIAKRLRKLRAATRREGRRIMRVLTAAIARTHPLSAEEACNLVRELLQCLDGSRVVAEARRLNDQIAELLLKMLATRYGAAAQVDGFPLGTVVEELEAQRQQRAAQRAASHTREARAGEGVPPGGSGTAEAPAEGDPAGAAAAPAEGGKDSSEQPGESGGQAQGPGKVSIAELPKTEEEFHALLRRALDLEGEGEVQHLLSMLMGPLWDRLHWWTRREEEETQQLEQLFQEAASAVGPPGGFDDLLNRMFDINLILGMADTFVGRMNIPTKRIAGDLEWWLEQR
ncbi:MAG TPA: hypothetical protein VKM93_01355, partial [Terriglobia bacterium]|nr:hypothetical protein [Terriglobia bacterium]